LSRIVLQNAADVSHSHFVALPKFPVKISVNHKSHKSPFWLISDIAKGVSVFEFFCPQKKSPTGNALLLFLLIQVLCHRIFVVFQNNIHSIFNIYLKTRSFSNYGSRHKCDILSDIKAVI